MSDLGVTIYVLLTYVHGVTSCILTRSHVFLGTWIGSNDLIMGSVCVVNKILSTRAWQQ